MADRLRLLAVPFTHAAAGTAAVVVVSLDTMPYERSERYALLATVLLGVVVVATAAAMAGACHRRRRSRPVTRMAERATEWSEHDLDAPLRARTADQRARRAGRDPRPPPRPGGPVIRSEQRLTSELAHELRTPLTAIQGSADLALLRGVDDQEMRHELEQIAASAAPWRR